MRLVSGQGARGGEGGTHLGHRIFKGALKNSGIKKKDLNECRNKSLQSKNVTFLHRDRTQGLDQGEASGEGSGKEGSDLICLYNSDILDFCINFFLNLELLFLFVTEFLVPPSLCYP